MEPELNHIDTRAVTAALKKSRPSRLANPWVTTAVTGVCITTMSLIANLSLYQWGSEKSNQVSQLRAESVCRSAVAAETDVAQGAFLADVGRVQLVTAKGLAALGSDGDVDALVDELLVSSNGLASSLAGYLEQLERRSETAQTCSAK